MKEITLGQRIGGFLLELACIGWIAMAIVAVIKLFMQLA